MLCLIILDNNMFKIIKICSIFIFMAFISLSISSSFVFAADIEFSLVERRNYDQIHIEIWAKSLVNSPPIIGNCDLFLTYNKDNLVPHLNQGKNLTDTISNDYNQNIIVKTVSSPFNVGTYRPLSEKYEDGQYFGLNVGLLQWGQGGIQPSSKGMGTFVGKLVFRIVNGPSDGAKTGIKWSNGTNKGVLTVRDASGLEIMDKIGFSNPSNINIVGITILAPKTLDQVINRGKTYEFLNGNFKGTGYPIYFERSVNPDGLGFPIDPNLGYLLEFSSDNGSSWEETARVAETDVLSQGANSKLNWGNIGTIGVDQTYLLTNYKGGKITSLTKRDPLRFMWGQGSIITERGTKTKLRISILDTGKYSDIRDRGISKVKTESQNSFPMGIRFTSLLNGSNQYFKSSENYSNPTNFTVEAWINPTKIAGSEVGIVASSGGPDTEEFKGSKEGAWLLYLKDGKFPAFRARELQGRGKNGMLVDIVSEDALNEVTYSDNSDEFPRNWTHIAAILKNNESWLYVNGELVAYQKNDLYDDMRLWTTSHPLWIGVNPNNKIESKNSFSGGIKEVKIWRTTLSQEQIRKFVYGINNPSSITGSSDIRNSLEMYFPLQGDLIDGASHIQQNYEDEIEFFNGVSKKTDIISFVPDLPHIKISNIRKGSGFTNKFNKDYEIKWVGYGIGDPFRLTDDVALEYGFDKVAWYALKDKSGRDIDKTNSANIESGSVRWEPFENAGVQLDLRTGLLFERKIFIRARGTATNGVNYHSFFDISDSVSVAPYFSLKRDENLILYDNDINNENNKYGIDENGLFFESWIRPYKFPEQDELIPIISQLDSITGDVNYLFGLNYSGRLELIVKDTSGLRSSAISDTTYVLLKPNSVSKDTNWTHVAFYFNPSNNKINFYIDGFDVGAIKDSIFPIEKSYSNNYNTYFAYLPSNIIDEKSYGLNGEIREYRFWDSYPNNYSGKELIDFIQASQCVKAVELKDTSKTNLLTSFGFNGGFFTNNGVQRLVMSDDESVSLKYQNDGIRFKAEKPYIKLVEPQFADRYTEDFDSLRVRWVGFNYDLTGFSSGSGFGAAPALEFSSKGGGGVDKEPYQYVGSRYWTNNTEWAFTFPDIDKRYTFKGAEKKVFFAGNLNLAITDPDSRNNGTNIQGTMPIAILNARLRLTAKYTIQSTVNQIRTESRLFTVTPSTNMTIRVLLESHHKGFSGGNLLDIGKSYKEGGLRLKLYEDDNGNIGNLVGEAESKRAYRSLDIFNLNDGENTFANVGFLFPDLRDGKYWALLEHQNHLSIMSRYPATFKYEGDNISTWNLESGWDFLSWNGVKDNYLLDDEIDPWGDGYFTAFGPASSQREQNNYNNTALSFNNGILDRKGSEFPAMIAGDINSDLKIDSLDIKIVKNQSGTRNANADINGDGVVNALDRKFVLRNIGRVSPLLELKTQLKIPRIKPIETEKEVKQNFRLMVNDERFNLTAIAQEVGSNIELELFIRNVSSTFKMTNSTFAIKYDTSALEYNYYDNSGVIFSNNEPKGYLNSFSGPIKGAEDVNKAIRTIEIVFDEKKIYDDNAGINLPSENTSLGKLVFKKIAENAFLQFEWDKFLNSVNSITGGNITLKGEVEEIEDLKLFEIELLSPKGGDFYSPDDLVNIQWANNGPDINIEFSSNAGIEWEKVNNDPLGRDISSFEWLVPNTLSSQCLIRLRMVINGEELGISGYFTIEPRSASMIYPDELNELVRGGVKDTVYMLLNGYTKVDIELSTDNGINWTKVRKSVPGDMEIVEWDVPKVTSDIARIRLYDPIEDRVLAKSENFRILTGSVTYFLPIKGDTVKNNKVTRIRWEYEDVNKFDLQLSLDGGDSWQSLYNNVFAKRKLKEWSVDNIVSDEAVIRAVWNRKDDMEYGRTPTFTIIPALGVDENGNEIGNKKLNEKLIFKKIYPLPIIENGSLKYNSNYTGIGRYNLYDINGKIVISENIMIHKGMNQKILIMDKLVSGIYILEIDIDSDKYKLKVVKE